MQGVCMTGAGGFPPFPAAQQRGTSVSDERDIPGTKAHRQLVGQPVFTCYLTNKRTSYNNQEKERDCRMVRRQGNRTTAACQYKNESTG